MYLAFGPWRPDLVDPNSGATEALNCVPGADAYEPQADLQTFSNPLQDRVLGAIALLDTAGSVFWFAGDAQHLYTINTNTITWSNVSRLTLPFIAGSGYAAAAAFGGVTVVVPGGYAGSATFGSPSLSGTLNVAGFAASAAFGTATVVVPGGYAASVSAGSPTVLYGTQAYSTSSDGAWSFVQYGDNLYATNYSDPIQIYSLGASRPFADLGGGPPRARWLAVVKNFMVAANTYDAVDGARPQRVRWSGIDNPATWTVNATTQADFQDLLGSGGANQGIVAGLTQADAVVLQERAVWRMTYSDIPNVFTFDLVEGIRGTPAPGSIVAVGGIVYYLGEDGFYAFDGGQSVPIGLGKINRTFFDELDPTYHHRITSVADISHKLIYWAYPSTSSPDGNPDRILVFHWGVGEWSHLNLNVELLWRTLSFGYTLEELDAFGTVDSILISFDSRQWAGGVQQLSAFNTAHHVAHFSGANLAATITTREMIMSNPRRTLITQAWPIVACETATSAVRIGVGRRSLAHDSVSFVTSTAMNANGFCPQRTADHYLRFRVSLSSSAVWERAQGVDIVATPIGWR